MKSLVQGLRAAVMLAVLVVLPGLALLGKSCPQVYDILGRVPEYVRRARVAAANWLDPEPRGSASAAPLPPADSPQENWSMGPMTAAGDSPVPPSAPAAPSSVEPPAPPAPFYASAGSLQAAEVGGEMPVRHAPPEPVASPPPQVVSIEQAEQRLQALGALHHQLERWDNPGQVLYRFQCQMAVDAQGQLARYFEATDADPWRAVLSVLRQVEAWRAAQP